MREKVNVRHFWVTTVGFAHYMAVAQKWVPKMAAWQMATRAKTCGPIPGSLLFSHIYIWAQGKSIFEVTRDASFASAARPEAPGGFEGRGALHPGALRQVFPAARGAGAGVQASARGGLARSGPKNLGAGSYETGLGVISVPSGAWGFGSRSWVPFLCETTE